MSRFMTRPREPTALLLDVRGSHRRGVGADCPERFAGRKALRLHCHPAALALRRQPFVERRSHDSVRGRLLARGARCEKIGVLVLRMPLVAADPLPTYP